MKIAIVYYTHAHNYVVLVICSFYTRGRSLRMHVVICIGLQLKLFSHNYRIYVSSYYYYSTVSSPCISTAFLYCYFNSQTFIYYENMQYLNYM